MTEPSPARSLERLAASRLPELLEELLGSSRIQLHPASQDDGYDLRAKVGTRQLLIQIKSRGDPAAVALASHQLTQRIRQGQLALVVVPFMNEEAREYCARTRIDWIDLSGNADMRAEGLRILVQGKP